MIRLCSVRSVLAALSTPASGSIHLLVVSHCSTRARLAHFSYDSSSSSSSTYIFAIRSRREKRNSESTAEMFASASLLYSTLVNKRLHETSAHRFVTVSPPFFPILVSLSRLERIFGFRPSIRNCVHVILRSFLSVRGGQWLVCWPIGCPLPRQKPRAGFSFNFCRWSSHEHPCAGQRRAPLVCSAHLQWNLLLFLRAYDSMATNN